MERPPFANGSHLRPMRKLLEAKADANASDLSGEPPLVEAACYGDLEVCQLLLEARACAESRIAALTFADSEGHREASGNYMNHEDRHGR